MALLVPLLLVAISVLLMAGSHIMRQRRQVAAAKAAATAQPPKILIHSINDDRCTGCDACVAVCPTDVLELVNHKSSVQRFGDCIQCEQCMMACPTQALVMHWDDEEPPPLKVPHLDPYYQTGVKGMYLIGEVAGKPLVKNAANVGRAVVEHMRKEGLKPGQNMKKRAEGSDPGNVAVVDVVIVGSGPGGLSAAATCMNLGFSYVVLEKEQVVASTVARYPKGKDVMAEPYDVRNVSFLPIYDATKETMVAEWNKTVQALGIQIRLGEAVEEVKADGEGSFNVRTTVAAYRAQRVVLATGTRGKPRTLNVQGENLPKVMSLLDDPELYKGQDALVVGGGDSAIEAACVLADAGARVVLSYRGKSFNRAAAKNRDRVAKYDKEKKLSVLFGSQVASLSETEMVLSLADGKKVSMPNNVAFVLIGSDPPVAWLEKVGVQFIERPHWYALGATDQLVESLIGRLQESPREVAHLVALVKGQARPISADNVKVPVPEASIIKPLAPQKPSERPRTLIDPTQRTSVTTIGSAEDFFAPSPTRGGEPTLIAGLSLAEFSKRQAAERAGGSGKRKKVRTSEETRILRGLRDEGARLAHDETGAIPLPGVGGFSGNTGSLSVASFDSLSGVEIVGDVTGGVSRKSIPAPPPAPQPIAARQADSVSSPFSRPKRPSAPPAAPSFDDESTRFQEDEHAMLRGSPPPAAPAPVSQVAPLPAVPRSLLPAPNGQRPAGGPPPPQPRFIEARTDATEPPEFPVGDVTDQTEFEVVSRDPDDDGWVHDEATSMADPAMIERLRSQAKRRS